MLKRTALALGRSVKKCLRACKCTMQPISIFNSCSFSNGVHEQYRTELEPLDKRLMQTISKTWKTDLTLDKDGTGLCDGSADKLIFQHYLVNAYVNACRGVQGVQSVQDYYQHLPFNSNPLSCPLPFRLPTRNVHTLRTKTLDLKIHANPSKPIIPKPKKDDSLIVIREVKPLKNHSSPALDKDFSYYLNLQKANKIQKADKTIEKVPDNKKDIDNIWINPQFKRQPETMAKCGKEEKKEDTKSSKECKETDGKKKKEKSVEDICKLKSECSKMEKKIRAEMFMKMCKARAEKQKCGRKGKGDVKKELRMKCKKMVEDLKNKDKGTEDVKKEIRKKCKKMVEALKCKRQAEEEKCQKMAEEAKCKKTEQNENPKEQAEREQKLQCQAAELRVLQKSCQELADRIKCAKEAKRKELIKACEALIQKDRCEQLAKEKLQTAGGVPKKQEKCEAKPDDKAKLEAERYLRKQCAILAEQNRCRKMREKYKLEKRAAELKKRCELVAKEKKWRELDKQREAKEQAQLEKCQKAEEDKKKLAKSAPSK